MLSLLVENCGRVSYGKALDEQRKGILPSLSTVMFCALCWFITFTPVQPSESRSSVCAFLMYTTEVSITSVFKPKMYHNSSDNVAWTLKNLFSLLKQVKSRRLFTLSSFFFCVLCYTTLMQYLLYVGQSTTKSLCLHTVFCLLGLYVYISNFCLMLYDRNCGRYSAESRPSERIYHLLFRYEARLYEKVS